MLESTQPNANRSTNRRPRPQRVHRHHEGERGDAVEGDRHATKSARRLTGNYLVAYGGPVDTVFKALADPHRRQLLDRLNARNGQTLRELCAGLDMARQSVSKHLAMLEAAGLVTTVRRGREKLHYLNAAPDPRDRRPVDPPLRPRPGRRPGRPQASTGGAPAMDKPEFVYTTYIRTTPERLWQALTEPAFTERYWDAPVRDRLEGRFADGVDQPGRHASRDAEQVVLESDPSRRLSYTWHTFTPEWPRAIDIDEELRARSPPSHGRGSPSTSSPTATAGQAHGRPRRLRARQHGRRDGERRLAAGAGRHEVPARRGHE